MSTEADGLNEAERPNPGSRNRRIAIVVAVAVAALVLLTAVGVLSSLFDADEPDSDRAADAVADADTLAVPSASAAPEATEGPEVDSGGAAPTATPNTPAAPTTPTDDADPTDPGSLQVPDAAEVRDAVQEALDVQAEVLAEPEENEAADSWGQIASGAYRAALEDQAQEFAAQGLRQEGLARVDGPPEILAVDLDADPPTLQVRLCVDSTEVEILDLDGNSLLTEGAPTRTAMELTLQLIDGRWLIVSESFADPLDC